VGSDRVLSKEGRVPPSTNFRYQGGALHAEGVALERIAAEHGTPSYVYSAQSIEGAYKRIDAALAGMPHFIAYATKANSNLAVLRRLQRLGAGADIVSGGELARALRAGFAPDRIVFSGVGKSDAELRSALEADVRAIHVESQGELEALEGIAAGLGRKARVVLRVNPNVDAATHPYISTGLRDSKFGITLEVATALMPKLIGSSSLTLEGLACHVGSMVQSPSPIAAAVEIVARFARECRAQGAAIKTIDAGGGWPIAYGDEPADAAPTTEFGKAIIDAVRRGYGDDPSLTLTIEPGRAIVGDSGVLLARVLFVKEQAGKRFVVIDGAMTELIRPALYGAYHAIVPVKEPPPGAALAPADVVGPVCESSDFLAKDRPLPALKRGDLIAVRGAGAYAAVMGSTYNARPLAAEVIVDGSRASLVRKRQAIESQWQDELEE
jgi:diaminopimelate decarboxylase